MIPPEERMMSKNIGLLKKGTGSERPLDFGPEIWIPATCLSPF
jgi:hypothetical protein